MTTTGKHAREAGRKTKKRALALAALAMCCALMAGGTLAYFTAEERAHNVITSGGVEIALNEYTLEGGQLVPFPEEGVGGVMPGSSVDKLVEVENTGASDAWVRVKVTKAVTLAEGVEHEVDLGLIQMDFNEAYWEQSGDWWYYKHPLPAESAEAPDAHVTPYLFTSVTFAGAEMGNPYQNAEIAIAVQAQAVQVANNGTSALTASGWPTA